VGTKFVDARFFRRAATVLAHGHQASETPAATMSAVMFLAFIKTENLNREIRENKTERRGTGCRQKAQKTQKTEF
jgi:hypothetical protein